MKPITIVLAITCGLLVSQLIYSKQGKNTATCPLNTFFCCMKIGSSGELGPVWVNTAGKTDRDKVCGGAASSTEKASAIVYKPSSSCSETRTHIVHSEETLHNCTFS